MSTSDAAPRRPLPAPTRGGLPAVLLILLYLVLGSLPLFISWRNGDASGSFWRDLSDGMAMIAFALLTVQFLISGRIHIVSGRVGIDVLMHFHQLAAKAIAVALLLHPFLYVVPRLIDEGPAAAVARAYQMWTMPAYASGVTAWVLLVIVMAMAMLRDWLPIRYEAWRLAHGFGAASIAAAGLHHVLTVGSAANDVNLAQLWIILVVMTFGVLIYLYIVKPWQLSQRPFYVSRVTKLADKTWGVTVWPAKSRPVGMFAALAQPKVTPPIAYEAGQFVWLTLGTSPFLATDHPFSLASAPAEGSRLRFVVKEAGDFTNFIGRIHEHTRAYVDGPYGSFTLSAAPHGGKDAVGLAFIAGGVGIAPILGLLRDRRAAGEDRPMRLLYGNRLVSQIVARDELDEMAGELNFETLHALSEPPHDWLTGRNRAIGDLIPQLVDVWVDWPEPERWVYFVCGPPAMMDSVEAALMARGVPPARIISERFRYD